MKIGKSLFIVILGLLLLAGKAEAGWYHVENFTGLIGSWPIHLSLQTYDGFGSGITVEGSYFEDAKQKPVVLYGTAAGERLSLCLITDDRAFESIIIQGSKTPVDTGKCPISLVLDETGATGSYSKDGISLAINLKRVGMLDDTGAFRIEGKVEIPFWSHTGKHRYSGIYTNSHAGICMTRLDIIDRHTGRIEQTIDLRDPELCNAGMVMTPIYLNVEKDKDGKNEMFYVNHADNRGGHTSDFILNRRTGKYRAKK
jgi:hypothetical protein